MANQFTPGAWHDLRPRGFHGGHQLVTHGIGDYYDRYRREEPATPDATTGAVMVRTYIGHFDTVEQARVAWRAHLLKFHGVE